ncbi:23S rRNA (guanosine2251-2'-O)-methyltransferase [Saccharopolyspora lacisalsi]|uniref:23S rRNA (Guanosine2251-2'-O)-methyltransferase n=1 Tax=Halosaccharopolyspora lacisalsi TaxID=1000566 RepID=A0A839DZY7_9PSEU|nr:RNA methyltransferase [Halosaccharopolyspora lacisalsi]MBA8825057.1 23S rRNA (guanosine2251-2'-O)-methyltransferase [Halosaccharopolyspora lacisalsi]
MSGEVSPRDRFVTIYGRKPVLEALNDYDLRVDKVVIAEGLGGAPINEIAEAAADRAVRVQRASAHRVKVLAGNGRHDQGVVADVVAPRMRPLTDALADRATAPHKLLLLDGLTTPANVGMILRTATAAGIDGVVLPHRGVATVDPLVVKASAGIAFHAPMLRTRTAGEAAELLTEAGYPLFALDADSEESIFDIDFGTRAVFVLGGETAGLSDEVRKCVTGTIAVPMHGGVESLNVATAAAAVCFEVLRRRETGKDRS